MLDRVSVLVPARLHLGFLDLGGSLGRRFGSLGLAISDPFTRISLQRSSQSLSSGPDSARASRHLARLQRFLDLTRQSHHLHVDSAIPPHAGLGSGTQMALAVAAALRRLHGLELDVRGDAALLERGARSGIGIGLFETGGLVLDGGRTPVSGPPPILARLEFPPEWRIVLVLDHKVEGAHGPAEIKAFEALPRFSDALAGELCRLAVMQAMPAVVERDLDAFGSAITEIQQRLGDYFAPAQGGRYTSPRVALALDRLADLGATGIGQSSWGPTGFAFTASEDKARSLLDHLTSSGAAQGLDVRIVSASNRPAAIAAGELALDCMTTDHRP